MVKYQIKVTASQLEKPIILRPELNIIRVRGISDAVFWQRRIAQIASDIKSDTVAVVVPSKE